MIDHGGDVRRQFIREGLKLFPVQEKARLTPRSAHGHYGDVFQQQQISLCPRLVSMQAIHKAPLKREGILIRRLTKPQDTQFARLARGT